MRWFDGWVDGGGVRKGTPPYAAEKSKKAPMMVFIEFRSYLLDAAIY